LTAFFYFYYSRTMEIKAAIQSLSALAHEHRLQVFRLLVKHAPTGLPAGQVATEIAIPNNTLSTHLGLMTRAGLLEAHRDGRRIIYRASFDGMRSLLRFVLEDCCQAGTGATEQALQQVGAISPPKSKTQAQHS
ncbi:MAG: metalloregulator ArsR/SmtB family transcription factor, partial [Pseudomonadota bacterium]